MEILFPSLNNCKVTKKFYFKSLRNYKINNKENFRLKFCGRWGQHCLVLNMITTPYFFFHPIFVEGERKRKRTIRLGLNCVIQQEDTKDRFFFSHPLNFYIFYQIYLFSIFILIEINYNRLCMYDKKREFQLYKYHRVCICVMCIM